MENKKSLKYLFVAACLALLIVSIGGVVSASATAVDTNDDLKIAGASLDLSDKISIAFAVEASAIGYNAETNKAETNVYIYTENPTGTAIAEEDNRVKTLKPMTVGGKDYVMFISEGFAPVAYGQTVYVRLVKGDGAEFGKVYKTSVIELVKNLQAKLDTSDARYEAKSGLYNAILTYGQTAQKVLGNSYPVYNYFTVEDGAYVDNAGQTWTSGVVEKGTEITLVNNTKYWTVSNVRFDGWSDGKTVYAANTAPVNTNGATFAPVFTNVVADIDPTVSRMSFGGAAAATYTWNTIGGLAYTRDITSSVKNSSSKQAGVVMNRVVKTDADGNVVLEYDYGYKTYNFSFTPDEMSTYLTSGKIDNNKIASLCLALDSTKYNSNGGIQEDTQVITFDNLATPGSSATLSFDFKLPNSDLNGNGIYNEFGAYLQTNSHTETTQDSETGEDINTVIIDGYNLMNGDLFLTSANSEMMNLVVKLGGQTLFNIRPTAQVTNGIVTGVYLKTTSNGDSEKVSHGSVVAPMGEWMNISVKLNPAADGTVESAEVYLNGTLVTTHYASNGQAKLGFKDGYNNVYLCSDSKTNNTVNFETSSLARYLGTTQFKNMTTVYENAVTASDIAAVIADYNATAKNYTENVYVTAYTASGRTHYAWNELNTLAGANNFGTYATSKGNLTAGSWRYDANTNSVVYAKYSNTHNASNDAGLLTILIENPVYNMTWEAGTTVVFEYTQAYGAIDTDGDYKFSEWNDNLGDNNDVSGKKTAVYGYMDIGYGDGTGTPSYNASGAGYNTYTSISAKNSIFAAYRINNQRKAITNHTVTMSYRAGDQDGTDAAGNAVKVDNVSPNIATHTFGGAAITYRYELDIDENGVPSVLRIYINGELQDTRFNKADPTGKTNITTFTKATDAPALSADIFAAPYIEISYLASQYSAGTVIFSNIRAWSEINK